MTMLDQLLEAGQVIGVHENGFYYVNLLHGVDGRLHIWGPTVPWDECERGGGMVGIPRQRVRTPIHDHVWDMSSFVLGGHVQDSRYDLVRLVDWPFDHRMWECRPTNEGLVVRHAWGMRYVRRTKVIAVYAGRYYHVPAGYLHSTDAEEPAVTLMLRQRRIFSTSVQPRVMLEDGDTPDNEFARDGFDQEKIREHARYLFNAAMPGEAP